MFHLFFDTGPAIKELFNLGYEVSEDCFYELTCEQYKQIETEGEDISQKWYMLLPKEFKYQTNEPVIMEEKLKGNLLNAARIIEKYAQDSGLDFDSYQDKLEYASSKMPPVFSEDSSFRKTHLKLL